MRAASPRRVGKVARQDRLKMIAAIEVLQDASASKGKHTKQSDSCL